jgi:hypothetical protein
MSFSSDPSGRELSYFLLNNVLLTGVKNLDKSIDIFPQLSEEEVEMILNFFQYTDTVRYNEFDLVIKEKPTYIHWLSERVELILSQLKSWDKNKSEVIFNSSAVIGKIDNFLPLNLVQAEDKDISGFLNRFNIDGKPYDVFLEEYQEKQLRFLNEAIDKKIIDKKDFELVKDLISNQNGYRKFKYETFEVYCILRIDKKIKSHKKE